MKLDELLQGIYSGEIAPRFKHTDILSISCDSRKIMMGGFFVALKGQVHDGTDFIEEALARGAFAVAANGDIRKAQKEHPNICFLEVDNVQDFLHQAVRRLYGNPSETVRTVGITGTNGKTTVAYLVEAILKEAEKECGVIGTINYRLAETVVPAAQTTPNFIDNQYFLTGLAWQHVPYCIIEVSSHALSQDRVHGIDFKDAVFTNLTNDHLDYHETRENYFSAKARLFTGLNPESTAIINADDPYGQKLLTMTKAKIMTYGMERQADVMAKDVSMGISGSRFILTCAHGDIEIKTKVIGMYNIYNVLAAISLCLAEQISLDVIKQGIERLSVIPGRLERVECGQDFPIFIDYAHTQDALKNMLETIRRVSKARIILVFGCGGDRDQSKRCLMGQVAGQLADLSIVTSDNPRSENPRSIIDQIIPGFKKDNHEVVVNREQAIGQALKTATAGDIVLIAGKGHETYQVLADGPINFNERAIIEKSLKC